MTQQVPDRTVFERALPREEMDDITRALFDAALGVQEHAHAPYSNYHVGCSVLTSSGQIYVGANIENAAYPQGLCAEATALAVMASHGERQAQVVLTVCDSEGLATSCGGCRQKIRDSRRPRRLFMPAAEMVSGRRTQWTVYCQIRSVRSIFQPHKSTERKILSHIDSSFLLLRLV